MNIPPKGHQNSSCIVVGVVPEESMTVVSEAAVFAQHFHAELVCAWVDSGRYTEEEERDGAVVSLPLDPDCADEAEERFHPEVRKAIVDTLNGMDVTWSVRALAGGPAQEISRLAEHLDARMIVVGTRNAGMRGTLHEVFNGSVAVQLAHRQHRPVVVIPLDPVDPSESLPGEDHA